MNDFLFGLMIALSVGPVALMIANYGMRAGTATGVRAAIGVAAADGCYAVVAFTIGALLAGTLASHLSLFRMVGACVLLAMGARMLWQALRDRRRTLDGDVPPPPGNRPFMSMFFVTLANPLTILLFYGSAIGRFVKSPAWLAASHGVAALVVLGYGVAGLMRV